MEKLSEEIKLKMSTNSRSVSEKCDFGKKRSLVLEDGSRFEGISFGSGRVVSGECVFQTGMVSYIESLTDPSYRGQILVLSYPLIGNYGVPPDERDEYGFPKFYESAQIQVAGLIVADYSTHYSHWNAAKSLSTWLQEHDIPAIHAVDTRALIKKIRDQGTMLGKIVSENEDCVLEAPHKRHLVSEVSTKEIKTYGQGDHTILVIDLGMKLNQIRCLLQRNVVVKVVPWNYDFVNDQSYDGIFISNGPGNPIMCDQLIQNLRLVMERESAKIHPIPIFGICLGNQILGLAAGASTYKLKFGNRGHNQPCVDTKSGRCHLTMQNHGYAIDGSTLPQGWKEYFYNANDGTNEGICHESKPFFSVQFHPEANGGPKETEYLFDQFLHLVKYRKSPEVLFSHPLSQPFAGRVPVPEVKKVLILGSGGLTIGQAGEFDYSGSQAIKALKEEGITTVLINPNIATIQTTPGLADQVYFLPVTPEFVKKVIDIEHPDGLLLQFGGQTALNCGIALYREGYFSSSGIQVLGTPVEAILATEDRELFANKLKEIGEKIAPSLPARSIQEALAAAQSIGYPVIVRAGFALGGLGSGFAHNDDQLLKMVTLAFVSSEMVLVEKSLKGWKELEYEIVRDSYDNCVTVCNMENFDPLGIHTGESIVVAPSQTLSDATYHMLRMVSIRVARHIGIIGECNIQYALDPDSETYFIIEVNARLSRSSALASKATGYPLAFVACKLALGKELPKVKNSVTKITTACFEPSLDYVVVKVPRWDLKKFTNVSQDIGTAMKSVGEVMSIGRTFEEAISKAIRMVNKSVKGFVSGIVKATDYALSHPDPSRIFVIADALANGYSIDKIYDLTRIDRWFLYKLKKISDFEKNLKCFPGLLSITRDDMVEAKKLGFSDAQIADCVSSNALAVRQQRKDMNVIPYTKQIDTVAAEYPASNNYLYLTYHATESDVPPKAERSVIVLGGGAYCIGSSVEFDWCAVNTIRTLNRKNYQTIMINYNPETVSTDYDECSKLFFEDLSFEVVMDIYEQEAPADVILCMGGQIPNNLSTKLAEQGVSILGTTAEDINNAEDRNQFSLLMDSIGIDQPPWKECTNLEETSQFCHNVGYPCLVRPSYVLSGAGMNVVNTDQELENYIGQAVDESQEYSVVISKFITEAQEIDVDAVAQGGRLLLYAISEHVEWGGVHSGDATLMLPAQTVGGKMTEKLVKATRKIAENLKVTGPFNVQFLVKEEEMKVIECNLRASRSFPFVSKTLGINFIEVATEAMLGTPLNPIGIDLSKIPYVGVKVAQFSFNRLPGADPVLGVEMASTGEVACFGKTKHEAYLKGLLSTGFKLPKKNILLSIDSDQEMNQFLPSTKTLVKMGFTLYCTPRTLNFLKKNGISVKPLEWPNNDPQSLCISKHLSEGSIDLCIVFEPRSSSNGYHVRRMAVDFAVPLVNNLKDAVLLVEAMDILPTDIKVGEHDKLTTHTPVGVYQIKEKEKTPVIGRRKLTKEVIPKPSNGDHDPSGRFSGPVALAIAALASVVVVLVFAR